MKNILITGANSYIGTSFENYMRQWPDQYQVHTVDMINNAWRGNDFSDYNAVFHVAGIAHIKETKENAPLYYKINRDLAIETARKAKNDGVKQFIFLSSMSVYGLDTGIITIDTKPTPKNNYGKSKLQAEEGISTLIDSNFFVSILRPPMVYGKGCKGNFQQLIRIVENYPVFPRIKNQRSIIYIDNLSAFVKMVIDNSLFGVMFPQNREYACTEKIVLLIAEQLGKTIRLSDVLALPVALGAYAVPKIAKAFGSLIYKDMPPFDYNYCICEFDESVRKSI